MSTQGQTRGPSPRFYRQYIDENASLSAAPTPASTLPSNRLPSPSAPTRNNSIDSQAQPSRRSLDIASRVLGIGSSATNNAAVESATPLLNTRPTLALHLPNGRVLPIIKPPTSPASSRSRVSSLGHNKIFSAAQRGAHGRSVSEAIIRPTTPVTIVHPPHPPYRNASSDPFPTEPISSPIITLREPSPPPLGPGSPSQANVLNRTNNIGFTGENSTAPAPTDAPTQGSETRTVALDDNHTTDLEPSPPASRSSLEDHVRRTGRNCNHTIDVLAGRSTQLALHGKPSPRPETEIPTSDAIPIQQPPSSRSSFESTNSSRTRSIDLARTSDVQRLYHRASTQSLQTVKSISRTSKEPLSYNSTEEAGLSLEGRSHSLDIPRSFLPRLNHRTSTQSLQIPLTKPIYDTMIVNRFTPLNSHPVSPIPERAYTQTPSWIGNDLPDLEPAVHPRPDCLTITPPPSDITSPPIPPKIPLDTEQGPSISRDADYLPLFPSPPQASRPTWMVHDKTPGPVHIVVPPIAPEYLAFPGPDYPLLPPRPQAPGQCVLHTRIPSPSLHITPPMPDHPRPSQGQPHRPTQTAYASGASALRAAPTSAFHSPSMLSSPSNHSNSSNSSAASTTSTSILSLPTPQSPPTSTPSPKDISNLPLPALTSHVQTQISQARHLFDLVSHRLTPGENIWISKTISDTEVAMREILILTEGLRIDRQTKKGKLGLKTQLKWMMRDSRKAKEKRERLVLCNASLAGVLVRLRGVYSTLQVQAGNELAELEEKVEVEIGRGPSHSGNDTCNVYPSQRRASTLHLTEPESSPWDLAVQRQDAGMEVVVDEPVQLEVKENRTPTRFGAQSPTPTVSTAVSAQESIGSAASVATLDTELLDMLSWRWAQGRTM
ncbi:uncharacterized protein DSM5745_09848 [Aspergillus mulundensis]|uniref:Uncharacterized protein n=1 Tax=Aspergillus mulundensis TaxID=1810919 RepID=A0A3D8QRN0_9EURO|nr:hypothetical protein DSM5745_09848 [Aspergillus mulundensis]RDW64437.1 hypothetical protein DSM5745_09848 [Aspergillus mulundensis]